MSQKNFINTLDDASGTATIAATAGYTSSAALSTAPSDWCELDEEFLESVPRVAAAAIVNCTCYSQSRKWIAKRAGNQPLRSSIQPFSDILFAHLVCTGF